MFVETPKNAALVMKMIVERFGYVSWRARVVIRHGAFSHLNLIVCLRFTNSSLFSVLVLKLLRQGACCSTTNLIRSHGIQPGQLGADRALYFMEPFGGKMFCTPCESIVFTLWQV